METISKLLSPSNETFYFLFACVRNLRLNCPENRNVRSLSGVEWPTFTFGKEKKKICFSAVACWRENYHRSESVSDPRLTPVKIPRENYISADSRGSERKKLFDILDGIYSWRNIERDESEFSRRISFHSPKPWRLTIIITWEVYLITITIMIIERNWTWVNLWLSLKRSRFIVYSLFDGRLDSTRLDHVSFEAPNPIPQIPVSYYPRRSKGRKKETGKIPTAVGMRDLENRDVVSRWGFSMNMTCICYDVLGIQKPAWYMPNNTSIIYVHVRLF